MKKISFEEQVLAARREVDKWPQSVKDATEYKCSSPYYGETQKSASNNKEQLQSNKVVNDNN